MLSKKILILPAAALLLGLSGCGNSQPTPPGQKAQPKMQQIHKYVIGKTTEEDVIAELGNPSIRSINSKGEEILIYRSSHLTGKAWIPFYYGSDRWRIKVQTFTFDKNHILKNYAVTSNHY